jgi:hypothetical protein
MSGNTPSSKALPPYPKSTYIIGAILIGLGLMLLLSQYLKATWITIMLIPALGIVLLSLGLFLKRYGLMISGSLVVGLGLGAVFAISGMPNLSLAPRIGVLLMGFGMGWFLITLLSIFIQHKIAWWSLVPAGAIGCLGLCLVLTPLRLLDFVLYLGIGVGLPLLIWGIFRHVLGLIIPGCIVTTVGVGIFMAWQGAGEANSLAQTGVMLVWFAIGWGLITLFSRSLFQKFIWWPLIPGGVLAMVGWGLYIGGNPGNASSFISNTGSVALIIIGLYLLLIRKGIQQ